MLHPFPHTGRALAMTGDYHVVCCGHNHKQKAETIGQCLLINPGELLGKDEKTGFMLLDTNDKSIHRIEVGDQLDFNDSK